MAAPGVTRGSSSQQRSTLSLLALLGLVLNVGWLCAQQPIPPLSGRVMDLTETLTESERQGIERKLVDLETRKGAQIVVLMVATTAPEPEEAYALRVAEAWQIGRGEIDDGVVLLIAKDDRRLRIEVGYGLEGAVPDALANRIIDERILPRFRDGDFAGGVNDGVDALIALIDGEPLPEGSPAGEPDTWGAIPIVLMFAAFAAPLFRRVFGTLFGAAALGGAAGLIVWLISSVLLAAFAAGAVAFLFALAGIAGGPGRWSSGGGHWAGGRGRGGFGGGGGGGGFRGGGGRFGGGGASGGW